MGEITVLANHIPLVANLVPGEVHYVVNGKTEFFAVSGGFIEVKKGNKVVILADTAEFGHEIDITRAEEARTAAKELMKQVVKSEHSYAQAAAILMKHNMRIKVAKKHRSMRLPS